MTILQDQTRTLSQRVASNNFASPVSRWMQVVPHLDRRYGGMSTTVPQLGSSLAEEQHIDVDIAAFCPAAEADVAIARPNTQVSFWPSSRAAWIKRASLREQFRASVQTMDGIHLHGLWETSTAVASHAARSVGTPYVVSAHGMLEPWALANKRLKKRLYSAFVERANLEHAACLHALTLSEANDYRRFGCRRPIAVIPNGITIPLHVDSALFFEIFRELSGRRIVLFLGRIHFKKGLDILVRSWAKVAKQFSDAVLVIAGPDSENTQQRIETLVQESGLAKQVIFTGMLAQPLKWSALAAAHCFVLPSYSEGLSVAVLEAMGTGLPVLISEHCNLPEVKTYGAGWVIKADVQELTAALQSMLHNQASTNRVMGARGQALVRERFTWATVASQMADLYRWIQRGTRPLTFELLEVPS